MYFGQLHKKTPENWSTNVVKKSYLSRFQVLEFFSTNRNDRIFLSSRALKKYHISMNLCILVGYTRKHPKIGVSMSSKKVICVGFGFSNFFRLLETTEFFFLLLVLKVLYQHELMYFAWLHKKTPENWRINVHKKSYLGRFRVLDFFSTTRNDQIFLFSRALLETHIIINLCILVVYTRIHLKITVSKSAKKNFAQVLGSRIFFDYSKRPNFSFPLGLFQRLISA